MSKDFFTLYLPFLVRRSRPATDGLGMTTTPFYYVKCQDLTPFLMKNGVKKQGKDWLLEL